MTPPPDVRVSRFAYLAPFTMGALLAISAALLTLMGWIGGTPEGARTAVSIETACGAEWGEMMKTRAEAVGMGEPVVELREGGVTVTATFPGLEDDLETMPALLLNPGKLEIFGADESGEQPVGEPLITERDIVDAHMSLDARGFPFTDVEFHPEAVGPLNSHAGAMLYFLNGEMVDKWLGLRPFSGETVRLQPRDELKETALRRAVDWGIVLSSGPAPCDYSGLTVTPLGQ